MATGQLRVYFGAAPGVGKTYKMLEEAHRRLAGAPMWSSVLWKPMGASRLRN